MKTLSAKAKISGFTLVELLVVICIIAVFWAIFLPAPTGGPKMRATLTQCLSNQRQITIGFIMWNNDHGGKFPWQVSTTNNGTMESSDCGYDAPNFDVIDDYIKQPRIFVCPTDEAKTAATNNAPFQNQNISYFVGLDLGTNQVVSILTGDRHLQTNQKPVKPGLFVYSNNLSMDWTLELHGKAKSAPIGVLCFLDGHGETTRGHNLNSIFQRQGSITNRLCIP